MNFVKESEILKVLGHPVRLKIAARLLERAECNVNTMVENLGVPQSTVSQHLGILKNKGIIGSRKKGVQTCYYMADERIKKIIEALK
jgi:ArsR family transcriptional regulator